jgi:hypothetical protein
LLAVGFLLQCQPDDGGGDSGGAVIAGTFQNATSAVPGSPILFQVIAGDPEGEPITFSWSAAAGRLSEPVSDATTSRVAWTAPFLCAPVPITVTITDASGSSTSHTFTALADVPLADVPLADVPLADVDVPDGDYIDANCDGIDGDIDQAFFVSSTGSDAGTGTQLDPFRTIGHAVAQAAADPARKQVLVAAGTYAESLTLPDGVGVFGQYAATDWSRAAANATIIDSPTSVGVRVANTTAEGYLEGLVIRTTDAGGGANSARAVVLENLGAAFYVRHNDLRAGRGASGASGMNGKKGGGGYPGGSGNWFTLGSGGAPAASAGGSAATCSGWGGAGDQWGGAGPDGAKGAPGDNFGGTGKVGGNGSAGANGSTPAGQGQGSISGNDWRALGGGSGVGGHCGGGGGGGGTNACICWPGTVCALGGGGGGGGGAGGTGGQGGQGGGGSFGVLAIQASTAVVTDNTITTAGGGAGGSGGSSGARGPGGLGAWTPCWGGWNGAGGLGGNGGDGGLGGKGAGGAGGMSVGILQVSSPRMTATANTTLLGPAGTGGVSSGSSGAPGIQSDLYVLP